MLTEVGHGLDARNLETTATLLLDGGFELHSHSWAAAKFVISHHALICPG
jgi:alkylation response protein AidB-like acyl-CoA dehydrogenase